MNIMYCPCRSGALFTTCCAPYIEQRELAPNAQTLMRSRYTAYALASMQYIMHTQTGPAAAHFSRAEANQFATQAAWQGLQIIRHFAHPHNPAIAYVEFKAHYTLAGKMQIMHEISEFHKIGKRWLYYRGEQQAAGKVGRNDPCPCGSGKKYKKCCGSK